MFTFVKDFSPESRASDPDQSGTIRWDSITKYLPTSTHHKLYQHVLGDKEGLRGGVTISVRIKLGKREQLGFVVWEGIVFYLFLHLLFSAARTQFDLWLAGWIWTMNIVCRRQCSDQSEARIPVMERYGILPGGGPGGVARCLACIHQSEFRMLYFVLLTSMRIHKKAPILSNGSRTLYIFRGCD